MKRIRLLMFLTLLTGFILSACSCDDIVMDNVQEQKDGGSGVIPWQGYRR